MLGMDDCVYEETFRAVYISWFKPRPAIMMSRVRSSRLGKLLCVSGQHHGLVIVGL